MRRKTSKNGMTLAEVMVSMLVAAVASLVVYRGVTFAYTASALNRQRLAAINFAQAKMEELRNLDYYRIMPGAPNATTTPGWLNMIVVGTNDTNFLPNLDVRLTNWVVLSDPPWKRTTNYWGHITEISDGTLRVYVMPYDDTNDLRGAQDLNKDTTDYKRVRIDVAWKTGIKTQMYTLESILSGISGNDYRSYTNIDAENPWIATTPPKGRVNPPAILYDPDPEELETGSGGGGSGTGAPPPEEEEP